MRWLLLFLLALVSVVPAASAQQWTSAPARPVLVDLPVTPADWSTVPGTYLRVHGPLELVPVLMRVARHGSEVLPDFAERLNVPIGSTIHIYVAPDDATFRQLQPGRPPTWADATAWPELGVVFLRAPDARQGGDPEPLEQVLEHELVHILIGRAFAPNDPPAWLQEGAAQVLANQLGPEEAQILARGAAGAGLISLDALQARFPVDARRAELAYAQSADFLAFLMETGGDDVLPKLVESSRAGGSIRQVVYTSTGRFLEDAEAEWKARHTGLPIRLAALANLDWVFGLGALALVIAWVRRRRQFKRRLEEMGREEDLVDELVARWARRV
jgi:Peptidase MA superfamily